MDDTKTLNGYDGPENESTPIDGLSGHSVGGHIHADEWQKTREAEKMEEPAYSNAPIEDEDSFAEVEDKDSSEEKDEDSFAEVEDESAEVDDEDSSEEKDEDSFAEVEDEDSSVEDDEDSSEETVKLHGGKGSRQAETKNGRRQAEPKNGSIITVKITAHNVLAGIIVLLVIFNTAAVLSLDAQINTLNQNLLLANNPGNAGNGLIPLGGGQPSGTGNNNQNQPSAITASADDDPFIGPENAKVTVIEFSDFECPYCAAAFGTHEQLVAQFKARDPAWEAAVPKLKELAKQGKIRFVYRDFPLSFHQNAQKAAEAAECADEQGKFWEMHDKIFENQAAIDAASLKKYAGEIGLDSVKFSQCLDSGKMAAEVKKDLADGSNAGVDGTPAFFINGLLVSGAQPFSVFEKIIEAELAK